MDGRLYPEASGESGDPVLSFVGWARRGAGMRAGTGSASKMCLFGKCGFSIAGDVMMDLADGMSPVSIPMVDDSRAPGWVDGDTVSVLMLETRDGYAENLVGALRSRVIIICPEEAAHEMEGFDGVSVIAMPEGYGGWSRAGFCLGVLVSIAAEAGIVDASATLEAALDDMAGFSGDHKALARSLAGRTPAVYSTSDIHACSRFWRLALEESLGVSFWGELPEFDHNELVGWSDPNVHASTLQMVVLDGEGESGLVTDIVGCMGEVLRENGRHVVTVGLGGGDALSMDLKGIALGIRVAESIRRGSS